VDVVFTTQNYKYFIMVLRMFHLRSLTDIPKVLQVFSIPPAELGCGLSEAANLAFLVLGAIVKKFQFAGIL